MLKILTAIISITSVLALSVASINLNSGFIIAKEGKSSGEFLAFNGTNYYSLINLDGGCFVIDEDKAFNAVKTLNAKLVHYFSDGEIENYYFYSEKLPKKEIIAGKKVNVHVAVSKNKTTLGVPLIYYGY